MRFLDLANKLTGISCPIFGVSWNPSVTEREVARQIIIFLEPRRVLYSEYDHESVHQCVSSIIDIKNYLTKKLSCISEKSELNSYIRAMRIACNKCLSQCADNDGFRRFAVCRGTDYNRIFTSAIGELRCTFGIMIGQIAISYGIDVEDDLAQIIPD